MPINPRQNESVDQRENQHAVDVIKAFSESRDRRGILFGKGRYLLR